MAKRKSKRSRSRSRRASTSFHHVRRGLGSAKFWTATAWLSGALATFQSVTKGDAANLQNTPAYTNGGIMGKLQILATCFVERITNGALNNQSVTTSGGTVSGLNSKPTWKLSNVLTSPFTWLGIGTAIYNRVPGLPQRSKVGKFAAPMIIAGIAALLDDPVSTGYSGVAPPTGSGYAVTSPIALPNNSTGYVR